MISLTPELLSKALGCSTARAQPFAGALTAACAVYRITSFKRLAAFLAQIGHESGALVYTQEIASGKAYEGRADLGNTEPGDGVRYKGRGLIQTTGRSNYERTTLWLRAQHPQAPDFVAEPDELERPQWAAWSAAAYWHHNKLNALADADKFVQIGRAINRGNANSQFPANGEADRLQRWERAKAALASFDADFQPTQPAHLPAPKEAPMLPAVLAAVAGPLASALIEGFTPLAKEKLTKEMARHTDKPEVAEQIANTVIDAAKTATGLQDPIAAVAAAREAPHTMQRVEQAAVASVDQLLPLLERLNAMEQGNIRAAREFNAGEPMFIDTPWVRMKFVQFLSLVFVGFAGSFVMSNWADLTSELKGAVITLMVIAGWNGVRDYWMGSSNGSNEKTALLTRAGK